MKLCIKMVLPALVAYGSAYAADPHDVSGAFATSDGDTHILIDDCGDGTPCGSILWIDPDSLDEGETPETLVSATGTPVLGLQILQGFQRAKNDWRQGTIYSPEDNKTYRSRMKRIDDKTLQVKGCIGPICRTQIWTKVDINDD